MHHPGFIQTYGAEGCITMLTYGVEANINFFFVPNLFVPNFHVCTFSPRRCYLTRPIVQIMRLSVLSSD